MEGQNAVRLITFIMVFIIVALLETRMPRRAPTVSKRWRWFNNLSIIAINPIVLRLVLPVLAVGMAQKAQANGWGMLNYLDISGPMALGISIIVLDLIVWLQHVMFHAVPLLWRLHMVHHTDLDYDLTTGLRFHPIEIVISMILKLAIIVVLGLPPTAVLTFEIVLNGMALFNHANIKLPPLLDRYLRFFIVTPDMHRVHHSVIIRETNSNYGFNFSIWDRMFGTYLAQPSKGHEDMIIGLSQYRDHRRLTLPWLLVLPFLGDLGKQRL